MKWNVPCPVCGKVHETTACPTPAVSITLTPNCNPVPLTPNNCMRFIYGQGCFGCHNHSCCWPTSLSTTGGGR